MGMTDSPGYVDPRYLEAAAELMRPVKTRSYELMRAGPGQSVLDVGCGPGIDTLALAERVGPSGRVLGVDADPGMVETANRRAQEAGLAARVRHRQADAGSLPLETDGLDACRSERLFIHLADPARALGEMVRVTRPGGWVLVADSDWGTLSIDTTHTEIERRLARFRAEQLLSNGYSGRRLPGLLERCGLQDIEIEVRPILVRGDQSLLRYITKLDEVEEHAREAGLVTQAELDAWRHELRAAEKDRTFFAYMSVVLAVGRKP